MEKQKEHCPYCPQCGWYEPPVDTPEWSQSWRCHREGGSKKCQQVFDYALFVARDQMERSAQLSTKEETQIHE